MKTTQVAAHDNLANTHSMYTGHSTITVHKMGANNQEDNVLTLFKTSAVDALITAAILDPTPGNRFHYPAMLNITKYRAKVAGHIRVGAHRVYLRLDDAGQELVVYTK